MSVAKRFSLFMALMILLLVTLGLPLDTWWQVAVLVMMLMVAALTKPNITVKKGVYALLICGSVLGVKSLLPLYYIEEGGNVFMPQEPVFKQLPQLVYNYLNKNFQKLYPDSKISSDHKLYAFSMEQFHQESPLSRKRISVNFTSLHDARFGFMNKLNYNTYYGALPKREHLPFFMRYELPPELATNPETKVCWKGQLFVQDADGIYEKRLAFDTSCFSPSQEKISTFYGVSIDPEVPLSLEIKTPLSQMLWLVVQMLVSLLGALLITHLFHPFASLKQALTEDKETRFKALILLGSLAFSLVVALVYRPHFASGFLLYEGGNDALTYSSMARLVMEALFAGDWQTALMGGEDVFDLMPLHRYTFALNLFLFGETHLGYFALVLFAPLTIYYLTKHLFGNTKWAFALAMIFAVVPVLETFGFTQLYMVRLCMRGFVEPLSYMAFFTALALGLPYLKTQLLTKNSHARTFFVGLCLAIAVGARPNVAPGAGIFLLCVSYGFFKHFKMRYVLQHLLFLGLGFAPILLIPLHNYVFGDVFVLFTVAGQKVENLAVSAQDYVSLLKGIMDFNIPQEAWSRISTHLTTEIKPRQPWFYFVLLLNMYGFFSKRLSVPGKAVALTGLVQLSIVLFYNVGGRYGYLHWSLLLLGALLVLRSFTLKKA